MIDNAKGKNTKIETRRQILLKSNQIKTEANNMEIRYQHITVELRPTAPWSSIFA
jgi:hypothetical protein